MRKKTTAQWPGEPRRQGLYDPRFEHDSCGVGFVVDIKGKKSNRIIQQGLEVLLNLNHRGACGCEANTGDGAGILMQVPHEFLCQACRRVRLELPSPGEYGVGMVYLPPDPSQRRACERQVENIIREEGQFLIGWRTVPTNDS